MKKYQSIDYFGDHLGIQTIGFEKIDGSNLRAEYSQKRGFYKFGTKNQMIDENDQEFGKGVKIFCEKYASDLTKVFKSKEYRNVLSFVCYFEFVGKNSKFGQHETADEFDVVLFDIDQYKKGFVKPKRFIKDFGYLHIPKIVYQGNLNKQLFEWVKTNSLPGYENKLWEGVVCKSEIDKENIYYCKIKTQTWLDELKEKYGENRLKKEEVYYE